MGEAKGNAHYILCCIVTQAAALKTCLPINNISSQNREVRRLSRASFINKKPFFFLCGFTISTTYGTRLCLDKSKNLFMCPARRGLTEEEEEEEKLGKKAGRGLSTVRF